MFVATAEVSSTSAKNFGVSTLLQADSFIAGVGMKSLEKRNAETSSIANIQKVQLEVSWKLPGHSLA